MQISNLFNLILGQGNIDGTDITDVIIGSVKDDTISAKDGDDAIFGLLGDDIIAGNKGDDLMFGGAGDDLLVWNNGDGSDLMDGGAGYDVQQVNFDTDLVNTDLQNADVAEFSVTEEGVQFARTELNGQSERGLFQLDIRNTERQETNFGGGDDAAVLKGEVLEKIKLYLDGGAGVDALDLSELAQGISVNLKSGSAGTAKIEGFENVIGSEFGDKITGDGADNTLDGLGGADTLRGLSGDDIIAGNKGNDRMFGGQGNDLLVWNNGDGSDLMDGGAGYDIQQVNFDTDLVNTDLQNDDVAEYAVGSKGIEFARTEVNGQSEVGLFQLDIRKTERQETNFGAGDDTAVLKGNVIDEIELYLDGGEGVDTLDLSQASGPVAVNLETGAVEVDNGPGQDATAVNFENVIGTSSNDVITGSDADNVIRGAGGNDTMSGGDGADSFVFVEGEIGVDVILDFEFGVDLLLFQTTNPDITADNLLANLNQVGDDVELAAGDRVITFEDVLATDFSSSDFSIF